MCDRGETNLKTNIDEDVPSTVEEIQEIIEILNSHSVRIDYQQRFLNLQTNVVQNLYRQNYTEIIINLITVEKYTIHKF